MRPLLRQLASTTLSAAGEPTPDTTALNQLTPTSGLAPMRHRKGTAGHWRPPRDSKSATTFTSRARSSARAFARWPPSARANVSYPQRRASGVSRPGYRDRFRHRAAAPCGVRIYRGCALTLLACCTPVQNGWRELAAAATGVGRGIPRRPPLVERNRSWAVWSPVVPLRCTVGLTWRAGDGIRRSPRTPSSSSTCYHL